MPRRATQFQTIRTEGAILPADIVLAIASLKVDGVSPESYHLSPGTKLNEAISRSWTTLLAHWKAFQEARTKLPDSDETATPVTNDRWLLPLFKELDYGRLTTVKAPELDGRVYPIERFYQHTPIHLIGCKLPLDRRTQGARGAATANPHSMMQEYLNRAEDCLWGFLSNGLELRILRDNVSLSRQAYVQFDLQGMFEGEVYSDFALLWMLCHQSRVEAERPHECWLEKWSGLARERGTRVLAELRNGVQKSIEALGRGFISHPRNDILRDKLRSGRLATQDYYRELLRIVYRLLFLFVAEDRGLLHPPEAGESACRLYDEHYSTARLREMAQSMRGSKHPDLWHSLSLVFDALGQSAGCPALGIPGLGSFLWRRSSVGDLIGPASKGAEPIAESVLITNDDLLAAIRELAFIHQDRVLRTVDYRNLGSEELGSVYESLLELHPEVHIEGRGFALTIAAGHERKTTGSYYTPDSLVQCLLDSALEPVVEDRIKGKKAQEAERAILAIKVCDPACGSGHFLIAAAHRLARHLARARTGETEPSPGDYQHALRDTIGHCVYGVDVNPMAVELCQVALWMEAIEPGKPLSFLENHIQSGNSLLGTTPALLANGIPDAAFTAIEEDVKPRVADLKKQNKRERQEHVSGQGYMFESLTKVGNMAADFARISLAPNMTIADVRAQEDRYAELIRGADYQNARLLADTWCAVFIWRKDASDLGKLCPTERDFRKVEDHASVGLLPHVRTEVERLRDQYRFFHWHLAFPDVFRLPGKDETPQNEQTGWSGGFDVMLGNPPWERIQVEAIQFFETRRPELVSMKRSDREEAIRDIEQTDNALFGEWISHRRFDLGTTAFMKASGRYPLSTQKNVNSYAVFLEMAMSMTDVDGFSGLILQSGIVTDDIMKPVFQSLVAGARLVSFFDFVNTEGLFPGIHRTHPHFCLLTTTTRRWHQPAQFSFWNTNATHLMEAERRFTLSSEEIAVLNPNTRTCPIFRLKRDAELAKNIYARVPVLWREDNSEGNPWPISMRRVFDMTYDSHLFRTEAQLQADGCKVDRHHEFANKDQRWLRLYEAKFIHQFDHRFATFVGGDGVDVLPEDHARPEFTAKPRYWVDETELTRKLSDTAWDRAWLIGVRDITNSTNERTTIVSVVPRAGLGNTAYSVTLNTSVISSEVAVCLAASLNSFCFDWLSRQKVSGTHLNIFILKQLPALPPGAYSQPCPWSGPLRSEISYQQFLLPRVLELTYTAWDLELFARDCGYAGPPFRWDEERRFLLRAELDATFFHLYAINRDDAHYILDTFPIVRRKDIEKHGEYRTQRVILEIYDALAEATRTGQPYLTFLDPPPADPRLAHPPRSQQFAQADVVADVLLLLQEWNTAVSILALEPAVLLMQDEGARNAFLGRTKAAKATAKVASAYKPIEGMDLIYQGLVANGAIEAVGQNGYRILKPELIAGLSAGNRQRAKQVIEAIRMLDRPEDALVIVAEIMNERYSVAIS